MQRNSLAHLQNYRAMPNFEMNLKIQCKPSIFSLDNRLQSVRRSINLHREPIFNLWVRKQLTGAKQDVKFNLQPLIGKNANPSKL